jgi:hypothetical protein
MWGTVRLDRLRVLLRWLIATFHVTLAPGRLTLATGSAAVAVMACSGGGAKAPNPTRPLDERRAIEVIRQAVKVEGVDPAPSRDVTLQSGKEIRVDVSIADRDFGISYITREDAEKLGDAIPPRNQKDERLRIARAGPDGETRIVLLYQENYVYDDLVGEEHERTAIAAEKELARDVQDFVTYAKTQKYK